MIYFYTLPAVNGRVVPAKGPLLPIVSPYSPEGICPECYRVHCQVRLSYNSRFPGKEKPCASFWGFCLSLSVLSVFENVHY